MTALPMTGPLLRAYNNLPCIPPTAPLGDILNQLSNSLFPFVSVTNPPYNAVGNGVTDDTAAIQAALDAAGVAAAFYGSQQYVYLPAGVFLVSKLGSVGCLTIPTGVCFFGPGRTKMKANQPAQTMNIVVQDVHDFMIKDITIDGNCQNQNTDPVDPKKHGIFTRGSYNGIYDNVKFVNIDGDCMWNGRSTLNGASHGILIKNFYADLVRRSIVTVSGAQFIHVDGGYGVNWSAQQSAAINIETDSSIHAFGNTFENVELGLPAPEAPHTCLSISIGGGDQTVVRRCKVLSTIFVANSEDVTIEGNTIIHPGTAQAGGSGIQARTGIVGLSVLDNNITVLNPGGGAVNHIAGILAQHTNSAVPKDVLIRDNRVNVRDGLIGIVCNSLPGKTRVVGNTIDGNGTAGGILIEGEGDAPVPDTTVSENTCRNTYGTGPAIQFYNQSPNPAGYFGRLNVNGNTIIDDQLVPTCLQAIGFTTNVAGLPFGIVMINGNGWTSSIVGDISGIPYWLTGGNWDGTANTRGDFEGVGTPGASNNIAAKVGSTYSRRDGGVGTSFYIKQSSSGFANWVAIA